MPIHTNMRLVFDTMKGKQNNYNWLIANIEFMTGDFKNDDSKISLDLFNNIIVWVSGEELSKVIYAYDIQFLWGVFTAFEQLEDINIDNLEVEPYADGNRDFWSLDPSIQHPKGVVEIVCWDSTSTLFLSKDLELANAFKENFTDALLLEKYNKSFKRKLFRMIGLK